MVQPRGFLILVPNKEDAPIKKSIVTFIELKEFPGSWKLRGLDRVINGELRLASETEDLRHFHVKIAYWQRSVIAGAAREVPGEFDIWQRRNGYAIAVDCPRFLVDVAASLLSLAVYGNLDGFRGKNLRKEDFVAIQKHAFSLGGVLSALHLRNVKVGNTERSVYNTTGKNIGNHDDLIVAAKKVKRMGFRFPRLGDSEFHFWVADWGGGTLYQPLQFLPHHVITLAKFFEEALET